MQVTVVGAKHVPGKESDEVYVMLNLDQKYQVLPPPYDRIPKLETSVCPRSTVTINNQPSPHSLPIQVQQTERVVGAHPSFGKECVCTIAQTNRVFNAAVYAGQPGKNGEFIGGCSVSIFDVPSFPGMQSSFELKDDDGTPIVDAQV